MTTFNHVHPGQPLGISAEAHNAMLDAARAHRQAGTLAGREAARAVADRGVIWVRNNTGAALDQFGVVAIGLPIITADANENEFKQRVTFEGGTPAASDTGQFAVVIEAIPAGKIGRAVIAGPVQVKVNVVDEDHEWADVKDSDASQLESGNTGTAKVLHKQSGTGTKWAIVLLAQTSASAEIDAQINGGDQASGFTWTEQEPTSGGGWQNKDGGRNSTDDGKAYLTNDVVNAGQIEDAVVRLRLVELAGGGTEWRFDAPWPVPDTEHQVIAGENDGGTLRHHLDDVRTP